jgi:hypothetical protein
VDCATTAWCEAVFIAAHISFNHVSSLSTGIRHFPVKFAAQGRHTSPVLNGFSERLVSNWVQGMDFLGPGHEATADERTFEGSMVSQHFGLIITMSEMCMHRERTPSPTTKFIDTFTLFRRIHQPSLMLENIVLPWLSWIHILWERTNVILIFDHTDAQIF